ncbi:response regulator [Haliscomenobacter sp.]|uniref:response regulator n=1 Tax=Haliscomenobacter sp. TaxID=2717303 RepID=UPI003BAA916F
MQVPMEDQRSLLIVDDEEDVCLLLKRSFRREFKTVETAYLLKDALQVAERLRPDILLLDNNLPDGLGLEFVKKFKSINPKMYVILFSAMDLYQEAIVAGADVFLGKPLDLGVMREVMRR